MSLFRSTSNSTLRPSLSIKLILRNKKGDVLDEQDAWQALVDAFRKHPTLEVFQAEVSPNKDEL